MAVLSCAGATAESNRALITLVGEELCGAPAVGAHIFNSIGETIPGLMLHGSSPITINFIVDYDAVEEVIARLHGVFFDQLDPQVFD